MAITIGDDALWRNLSLSLRDRHGEKVTKVTMVDPTVSDSLIIGMLTAFFALTNVQALKGRLAGRVISGMPNSAGSAQYDIISAYAVLTFSQVSPENAELTLYKEFIIPAVLSSILGTDAVSLKTPDSGGDAQQIALNTIVTFCQSYLVAYIKSAAVAVVGGWTYQPSMSGLITSGRKFDGNPG